VLRIVRQGNVAEPRSWRPWWLLGLLEVRTFPRPRWRSRRRLELPALRAVPALGLAAVPGRVLWLHEAR
jgi:hypothetical protein